MATSKLTRKRATHMRKISRGATTPNVQSRKGTVSSAEEVDAWVRDNTPTTKDALVHTAEAADGSVVIQAVWESGDFDPSTYARNLAWDLVHGPEHYRHGETIEAADAEPGDLIDLTTRSSDRDNLDRAVRVEEVTDTKLRYRAQSGTVQEVGLSERTGGRYWGTRKSRPRRVFRFDTEGLPDSFLPDFDPPKEPPTVRLEREVMTVSDYPKELWSPKCSECGNVPGASASKASARSIATRHIGQQHHGNGGVRTSA